MDIKEDFDIVIKPLYRYTDYRELEKDFYNNNSLRFDVVLTNKKTQKIVHIDYSMGVGNMGLPTDYMMRRIKPCMYYMDQQKRISIANKVAPSVYDVIECIKLDCEAHTMSLADFLEEFGYDETGGIRKGIDIYNSCIAEYNKLLESYRK